MYRYPPHQSITLILIVPMPKTDKINLTDDHFTSLAALEKGFYGAAKGKRYRTYAAYFNYNRLENLLILQEELRSMAYQPKPHRRFIIEDPKKRLIDAPHFRDRIVHHAICKILTEVYEPCWIYDSYACREGKGGHAAQKRMQHFVRWQSSRPLYVLHIDISKYYASVNHEVMKRILRKKLHDPILLSALDTVINYYQSGNEHDHLFRPDAPYHTRGARGIPIGNLTSQIFGNIYLHEVDVYIKRALKVKRYIRYMDDLVLVHDNKQQLREWQQQITRFLHDELCLTVHPRKTRLFPAHLGVEFVGYVTWRHKIRVRSSSLKHIKKRWKHMLRQYQKGLITKEDLRIVFYSWVAHTNTPVPAYPISLFVNFMTSIKKLLSLIVTLDPTAAHLAKL